MLYLLYGTDTHKSREKLHQMLEVLSKKRPNSEVFKMTSENWSERQLDEFLGSQGLFDQKYIVVLDGLFEKKEMKDCVMASLEKMAESENVFFVLENKIEAVSLKKIEKYARQVQEFLLPETKKETFNIFSITDKLLSRDKKNLWVAYIEMISNGISAEEIHGILFWQIKNMILTTISNSQSDSGIAPFPYKKALVGSKNFKKEELKKMSDNLLEMTHRVRVGEGSLEPMLEKWILTM